MLPLPERSGMPLHDSPPTGPEESFRGRHDADMLPEGEGRYLPAKTTL